MVTFAVCVVYHHGKKARGLSLILPPVLVFLFTLDKWLMVTDLFSGNSLNWATWIEPQKLSTGIGFTVQKYRIRDCQR